MRILEFGRETGRKLLLIHGFQIPWQVWTPYIRRYQEDFHVLVPILPGHDPARKEAFHSFPETARELEDHFLSRWGDQPSFPRLMTNCSLSFYLDVTHKTRRRDKKTVRQAERLVPREYVSDFLEVLDNMSDETIINCVNGVGDYKLPGNISGPVPQIYYFHGTTISELFSKRTAKYLIKHYPGTVIKSFAGADHCQVSLHRPDQMLQALTEILRPGD